VGDLLKSVAEVHLSNARFLVFFVEVMKSLADFLFAVGDLLKSVAQVLAPLLGVLAVLYPACDD
jgi:hypothetical protein